jgi:hypothetical protein
VQHRRLSEAVWKRLKGLEPSTFCMASGTAALSIGVFRLQIPGF